MNSELENLSVEELEALVAKKKAADMAAREKERKAYEAERNSAIETLMEEGKQLAVQLSAFKQKCHQAMDAQAKKLDEYGELRSNSKGGFSITHTDGHLRITRRRDTTPYWDERATKGVQLIKEFIHETVKKRDLKLFAILLSFLERNKEGDLEYNKVMNLLSHEDKFDDPKWKEGLRLIREGYSNTLKGYGYEFKTLAPSGHWEGLTLNFSSI